MRFRGTCLRPVKCHATARSCSVCCRSYWESCQPLRAPSSPTPRPPPCRAPPSSPTQRGRPTAGLPGRSLSPQTSQHTTCSQQTEPPALRLHARLPAAASDLVSEWCAFESLPRKFVLLTPLDEELASPCLDAIALGAIHLRVPAFPITAAVGTPHKTWRTAFNKLWTLNLTQYPALLYADEDTRGKEIRTFRGERDSNP